MFQYKRGRLEIFHQIVNFLYLRVKKNLIGSGKKVSGVKGGVASYFLPLVVNLYPSANFVFTSQTYLTSSPHHAEIQCHSWYNLNRKLEKM